MKDNYTKGTYRPRWIMQKMCMWCGKPFDSTRKDAMFCRPAHRTADYRLRRKAKQEADKWQREQEFQRMAKTFKEVET